MYEVSMAFGHCRQDGEPLPPDRVAAAERRVLQVFARTFRGGQAHHRTGSYLGKDGRTVIEPCTIAFAYTPEVDGHLARLQALAAEIARALEQESVMLAIVKVEGALHWVGQAQPLAVAA